MITTFAGTGTAGYNGDDEAATATQLWSPAGIAINGGTVYVADGLNNRLRTVSQSGTVSTLAGNDDPGNNGDGGPATDASLNDPEGVALDNHGNIYISDKYNNRIRKITPAGAISAFAGTGEPGYTGDGGSAIACQLNAPEGLTVDSVGNVYIADAGNNCIRKVTPAGKISTIAGTGNVGYSHDGGPATVALLNSPKGVAVDTVGNIYIADALNYRIRKVTSSGIISTIAGSDTSGYSGDDKAASAAKLNLPTGVALDRGGNIYIADQGNNCIRKITKDGIITTVPITNSDSAGKLNAPAYIAVDGSGNMYVTEQQNNRVRRITPAPETKGAKNTTATKAAGTNTGSKNTNPPPPFSSPTIINSQAPVQRGYSSPPANGPAVQPRRHNNG